MEIMCGTCLGCRGRFKGSRCKGQRVWDLEEIVVLTYLQSKKRGGKSESFKYMKCR